MLKFMCVPVHCRLPGQQCRRDLLRQNQNQVQGHLHLLHQLRRRVSACLSINLRSALFPDFLAEADLISCIVCLARLRPGPDRSLGAQVCAVGGRQAAGRQRGDPRQPRAVRRQGAGRGAAHRHRDLVPGLRRRESHGLLQVEPAAVPDPAELCSLTSRGPRRRAAGPTRGARSC